MSLGKSAIRGEGMKAGPRKRSWASVHRLVVPALEPRGQLQDILPIFPPLVRQRPDVRLEFANRRGCGAQAPLHTSQGFAEVETDQTQPKQRNDQCSHDKSLDMTPINLATPHPQPPIRATSVPAYPNLRGRAPRPDSPRWHGLPRKLITEIARADVEAVRHARRQVLSEAKLTAARAEELRRHAAALEGRNQGNGASTGRHERSEPIEANVVDVSGLEESDPGGDRTRDPLIKSQMLYH
jgi:hypothetical protein